MERLHTIADNLQITITKIDSKSIDQLIGLATQYLVSMSVEFTETQLRSFIDFLTKDEQAIVVAASSETQMLAFLTAYFAPSTGLLSRALIINDLFVLPSHRRQSIATYMYEFAFEYARSDGVHYIRWLARPENAEALSFHRQFQAREGSWIRFTKVLANDAN